MARKVDGSQSVIMGVRFVIRLYRRFGAKMAPALTPELMAALAVLDIAIAAFEALDDQPGQIDHTPGGYGDTNSVVG